MKIGQMTLPRISECSDYLQLDICGLNLEEVVDRYKSFNTTKGVILHGDWTKKGASENDILKKSRQNEYLDILSALKDITEVIGFTVHPPFRSKSSLEEFISIKSDLEEKSGVPFFIENRSNSRILVSKPKEIISLSYKEPMTIDIPQLYISCGYDETKTMETLYNCNIDNIRELHLANIMRKDGRSYVARKLEDGVLNLKNFIPLVENIPYVTLEILGGNRIFEEQNKLLQKWTRDRD